MAKSKTSTFPVPIPSQFPWLVYFHGKRSNIQTFYDIERGNCDIKKIPDMTNKRICTNSHGWMVMLDLDLRVCFLLNPISMEKIMLPPWEPISWASCVLSLPPSDPTCIVAFFDSTRPYVMFCHPGEKVWREQEFNVDNDQFWDTVSCEGKIYCLSFSCNNFMELRVLGNHTLEMRQLGTKKTKWSSGDFPRATKSYRYLIESLGEIFMVIIVLYGLTSRIQDVCVFKMDFKKLEWTRVNNLGDHIVFFLSGRTRMSCLSMGSSGRVKENSIYFTFSEEIGKTSTYIYDMEEETITTFLLCPNVIHNVTQVRWIMPNRY